MCRALRFAVLLILLTCGVTHAQTITDNSLELPGTSQIMRVLSMRDYNTRIVVLGVTCLGVAAGLIGTFLLLRKRSLTADAVSHATLPGIALAFIAAVALGHEGQSLPVLLLGAFITGVLGVGAILIIRGTTRIKDDAALGIVLSVFFGIGMALVKIAEQMPGGSAAGLDRFILGRAASMIASDAQAILVVSIIIALACALLFKELRLLCFDADYARSQGWPVVLLDVVLMGLVVAVTVIGLQAVGLVLVVAMLIIPAAAARFWTDRLAPMTFIAAAIGAVSGFFGAVASALLPRMPTGPVIVLVCAGVFGISLLVGPARGVIVRIVRHVSLSRRIAMQHLVRAMYELAAKRPKPGDTELPNARVTRKALVDNRSWTAPRLRAIVARARRAGLLHDNPDGTYNLTRAGWIDARRVVRNHRLWEIYLITHADIAPSHVDRDADQIEHVLHPALIERLEQLLADQYPQLVLPDSPHTLGGTG